MRDNPKANRVAIWIASLACVAAVFIMTLVVLPFVGRLLLTPTHFVPPAGRYLVGDLACRYRLHVVQGEWAAIYDKWGSGVVPSGNDYPDLNLKPVGQPTPGVVGIQCAGEWWYGACQLELIDGALHPFYFIIDPRTCVIHRFDNPVQARDYLLDGAGVEWGILKEPHKFAEEE